MQLIAILPAVAAAACLTGTCGQQQGMSRRQLLNGMGDMGNRHNSPFAAFWNQGIVPGQGFPQIGMSAYGYGLPGLGLSQYLTPDALILAGVGNGEITEHDLNNLDRQAYGFDRFKNAAAAAAAPVGGGPDPTYPGRFKSEDCDAEVPQPAANADDGRYDDGGAARRHNHHRYDSGATRSNSNNNN
ncbi:hypothetical protein EV174_006253, partial [Coemansia sp. RSA 2320]